MASVGVVGGGIAGLTAASEANSRGVDVTLFEESRSVPPPKSTWPSLLSRGGRNEWGRLDKLAADLLGGHARLGEAVGEVDVKKKALKTARGLYEFDSIVIATGAKHAKPSFRGTGKKNVFVMRGYEDFLRLSEAAKEFSGVAVSGSGPLALTVAEKLVALGARVTMIAPGGILFGYLSEPIRHEVEERSVGAGVGVVRATLEGVAGVESVEAALAGGSVYPAEALIFFPALIPDAGRLTVERGRNGGILVDNLMRSSAAGVYAAGDCAEVRLGSSSTPIMFESAARLMGRAAGANSGGGRRKVKVVGTVSHTFFGCEVCYGGITLETGKSLGMNLLESSSNEDEGALTCALVFDRENLVVHGVQLSGNGSAAFFEALSLILSREMTLEDLAHAESRILPESPTDLSPLESAATEGLSLCGRD